MQGPSSRGLTHFVAAALPQFPTCAIKLSDGTSLNDVTRTLLASYVRVRSASAVELPEGARGFLEPHRCFLFFRHHRATWTAQHCSAPSSTALVVIAARALEIDARKSMCNDS